MEREFLESLGLEAETVDKILTEQGQELQREKEEAAQTRQELEAARQALKERDYADAIGRALAGANEGRGLKFSSRSAEQVFMTALRERGLELHDGELLGFEGFVREQREADPGAFAPDKPKPHFTGRVGLGGAPAAGKSRAAEISENYQKNLYGLTKGE